MSWSRCPTSARICLLIRAFIRRIRSRGVRSRVKGDGGASGGRPAGSGGDLPVGGARRSVAEVRRPTSGWSAPVSVAVRGLVRGDGRMPVDVLTEIVIDRLCAQVASYAADPSDAPRWYANIESVAWMTPPPVGLAVADGFRGAVSGPAVGLHIRGGGLRARASDW